MVRIVAASPEPCKTCFWLAAETGMRAGELCGLRWQDLDFERLIVCVVQTAWWGHLQTLKTKGSARRFSISAILSNHLQERLKEWKPDQYGLIFATRNGTAWTCRKPLRKLEVVLEKLELPVAGSHAFRHAQVTIAEREVVPLKTVQARSDTTAQKPRRCTPMRSEKMTESFRLGSGRNSIRTPNRKIQSLPGT
jgi:integrase